MPAEDGQMVDSLRWLVSHSNGTSYVEARCQSRLVTEVSFVNGNLDRSRVVENAGCGIRVLVDGCWGFSSINDMSKSALAGSLARAVSAARVLAKSKKNKVKGLFKKPHL